MEELNRRESAIVDALKERGALDCWERKVPSRKNPGQHTLSYEVDLAGASDATIKSLLARDIVRFVFESETDTFVSGKLVLPD
ncbi:hypothetical protein [Streptomyces atratus]|uniref:hypothetical protein n=1 Tax=Streptomyces atratus TaxID=1893 RepID=UPI00365B581F